MYYKRRLTFAIIFKADSCAKVKDMNFIPKGHEDEDDLETGVTLASCFNGYEKLETLSGNDQWYCRNCKEHRDITKKLEIYKVPKIMIL